MAEHTAAQKRFIVLRLAAFETPRDIAAAFRARFTDTDCTENDVLAADPRIALLPPDLEAAFYTERARILGDDLAKVAPFADQKARLIALSRQAERYEANNQPAEARAVYRQIAEETGAVVKGGAAKSIAPADTGEPVAAITRTIVDPKSADAEGVQPAAVPEQV